MPRVFICHASEDKAAIARPLALALRDQHVEVWFDEFSLKVGDSLRETIDRGLAQADFGVVIISRAFFAKRWSRRELNGLVAREMAGENLLVLPVWHEVDRDFVLQHSPPLADVFAVSSSEGVAQVAAKLLRTIRPNDSPLVVARDLLATHGIETPSVADEWWLDIAEIKQSQFAFPEGTQPWIFPLPFPHENDGFQRGANLASTALQLDWSREAEDRGYCQLTHPDILHAFLREMPGMMETARQYPGTLAMYAPQLTLQGFDEGFEDVFEALLDPGRRDAYEMPGYGGWETVDGGRPACGELIAWRHPTFGGLTHRHLAYSFVRSHDAHYSRHSHSAFDCLAWLLSDHSQWLPARVSEPLLDGFKVGSLWFDDVTDTNNALSAALFKHGRRGFKVTRNVRAGAEELFGAALSCLALTGSSAELADRFFEHGFVDAFYAREEERAAMRRSRRRR